MQHKKSAIQKKCNMGIAKHEKSATRKKVYDDKSAARRKMKSERHDEK